MVSVETFNGAYVTSDVYIAEAVAAEERPDEEKRKMRNESRVRK